jgi:tetratricopeptide (TPR) repeat protein
MNRRARTLALALCCIAGAAVAAGADSSSDAKPVTDPVITSARAAIAKQDWKGAQSGLQQALAANPNNADYHNLYAYAVRKGPDPDMKLVFTHYNEALRIDPKHRAAHEYIGEAFLQVNDLPNAREHLAALDRLCRFGCEEYTDLKKAVAAYEAKAGR